MYYYLNNKDVNEVRKCKKKRVPSGGRAFKQPNQLINKLITKSIKPFHSKFHSYHVSKITMFNYLHVCLNKIFC